MTAAAAVARLLEGDETFAVTGASGWLGRTALHLLDDVLGPSFAERVRAFVGRPRDVELANGTTIAGEPIDALPSAVDSSTIVLHFAFLTRDRAKEGDAYIRANLEITSLVLAALGFGVRGLLYASSGAVYRRDGSGELVTDLAGDPYGTLKHLDELAFRQACSDHGIRCVVERFFSVSGPYITKPELYALGNLILQATGGRIEVRARHVVRRSYVAALDAVAVGLAALVDPNAPAEQTLDSGGIEIEVGDLAALVAQWAGDVPVQRTLDEPGRVDRYVAATEPMAALAAAYGVRLSPIEEQIAQTARWLRRAGSPPA